jgi:hypothetical protein
MIQVQVMMMMGVTVVIPGQLDSELFDCFHWKGFFSRADYLASGRARGLTARRIITVVPLKGSSGSGPRAPT